MRWLIVAFIVIPTTELAILFYSGKTIGLLPTIGLILFTGFLGAYLAKKQGTKAWIEFHRRIAMMEAPGTALIDSLCIFIGGLMLLMPGFLTDLIGFLLLFQQPRNIIRPFILRWIYKKMKNKQIIIH